MPDDALELVRLRNNFYRDNYRRLGTALIICLGVIIFLTVMLFISIHSKPQPKYFATTDDGRILPLIPLNEPFKSTPEVLQMATDAAIAANSFDFVNYRKQLQESSDYFTPTGWQSYMKALQDSGNLDGIKAGKIIANAQPTGAPQIQEEGLENNAYYWKVTLPIMVTYQGQSVQQKNNYNVTMTIVRISTLDNPSGIGVEQMVLEQKNTTPLPAGG